MLTSARLAEERASPRPKLTSLSLSVVSRSLMRARNILGRKLSGERHKTENKTKPTRLIYVLGKLGSSFKA